MSFERAKFAVIQKCSKKFQRITQETKYSILKDIETFHFSRMTDELLKIILEGKFKSKYINTMMIVISELHQIYEQFTQNFLKNLKKNIN